MAESVGWMLGLVAAFQVFAATWCFFSLRHKSVRELWGIDWLDVLYRLERTFQINYTRGDFEAIPIEGRKEFTAGQLWELTAAKLSATGRHVPAKGWLAVVSAVSEAMNSKPEKVSPDSRLYADLGMAADIA